MKAVHKFKKIIQIHQIYWKNWNISIASCMPQVAVMFPEFIKKRSSFLGDFNVPNSLSNRKLSEGKISSKEYFDLLDSFHNSKTPGNNGIPIEFYKSFGL